MINNLDVIIDILFSLQGHDDCAIIFFSIKPQITNPKKY